MPGTAAENGVDPPLPLTRPVMLTAPVPPDPTPSCPVKPRVSVCPEMLPVTFVPLVMAVTTELGKSVVAMARYAGEPEVVVAKSACVAVEEVGASTKFTLAAESSGMVYVRDAAGAVALMVVVFVVPSVSWLVVAVRVCDAPVMVPEPFTWNGEPEPTDRSAAGVAVPMPTLPPWNTAA